MSNVLDKLLLSGIIPALVKTAQRIFGAGVGTGALKKAWVRNIIMSILQTVHDQKVSNNPIVEWLVDQMIEMALEALKKQGELPTPVPDPATPPVGGSIYFQPEKLPVPPQEELLKRGFKTGDIVEISPDGTMWQVSNLTIGTGWTHYETIGG